MNKLFSSLFAAAKAAQPEKKVATVQEETIATWNLFNKAKGEDFEQRIENEIARLKGIALRRKGNLMLAFWGQHVSDGHKSSPATVASSSSAVCYKMLHQEW
ncbi:MAG: hypothetical protein AAFR17_20880, partial [Pseudomonadota bacterium]